MKKKFTFKFMLLLCALVVGINTSWADSYTITFKTGSGDGTEASTSTACSEVVSGGSSYLSGDLVTANRVYYAGSDGLKLGASKNKEGEIKMNLASSVTPKSIVVNAKLYNSGKATTLSVNDSDAQSISSDFSDLTFSITSEISYIQLHSSQYCWIKSITVNYTSSGKDDCDLALTGAPIVLAFDLNGDADPQVINYTTSSTGAVSIDENEYATFDIDETGKTITVTPTKKTPSAQTITVNQDSDDNYNSGSVTFTISIENSLRYTVTFSDGGSVTQASYGAEVTLPSRSAIGSYTFAGWSTTNVVSETTTAPTIIPAGSYSPTANITLYPVYTRTVGGGSQSKTESVTISDYATANNWGNTSSDGQKTITIDSNVTATCSDGTNSGKYYNDGWRLYESESAVVTIETTSGELTSVTFTFTNSNNGTLNYNSSSITSGTAVNVSGESAEFSVSRSSGNSWGQIRMTAISVNYTIPGTTYYNSGYFMSISKWTDEDTSDGWYLIAAPVGTTAAASISNLTSNSYDLFRFNQAVENEWENYNDDTYGHNHFALEPGRGYLYANSNDVTLTFFDQSTSNSNDVTLTYSGANTNPKMRGWNLIGNPFATTATIKDSDNNAKPFYRMNDTHTDLIPETTTGNVNPMEGIFVHTTKNNEVVTFTTKRATESNDNLVVIDLSAEKGNVIDRAIVRFDEGETLPKFQLKDNSTKLYIQQGGKDYAIAFAYRMGMLPLNFKAEKTGKYTLGFSGENMNGVKLIDKIANVTVDLGIENEYSFIGMPNDREDRFALVFSLASSETSHDVFAYQNGNEIVVNGEGILEVFDVTGRKVMITTINGVQTLNSLNTGFYIFRLNEKTQKIVVR